MSQKKMRHCEICKKPLHKRNKSGYCTGKCYYKSPMYKKYQAEYQRKRYPEYKPRIKAYNKRPEVKERQKNICTNICRFIINLKESGKSRLSGKKTIGNISTNITGNTGGERKMNYTISFWDNNCRF